MSPEVVDETLLPLSKSELGPFKGILIPHDRIDPRIAKIADALIAEYEGKEVVFIGVLQGARPFAQHLLELIGDRLSVTMIWVEAKSYVGTKSSGTVAVEKSDLSIVCGKEVVIVEDIVETGRTIEALRIAIGKHDPASVEVASLLYKKVSQSLGVVPRFVGFSIPDLFVVGFGMDMDGSFRDRMDLVVYDPARA